MLALKRNLRLSDLSFFTSAFSCQCQSMYTFLKVKVAQSCPILCDPGILQARILEWVAISFTRGSPQARDWTQVSHIADGFSTSWATREANEYWSGWPIPSPADLPNPGIQLRSSVWQADSLPAELPGKLVYIPKRCQRSYISSLARREYQRVSLSITHTHTHT